MKFQRVIFVGEHLGNEAIASFEPATTGWLVTLQLGKVSRRVRADSAIKPCMTHTKQLFDEFFPAQRPQR